MYTMMLAVIPRMKIFIAAGERSMRPAQLCVSVLFLTVTFAVSGSRVAAATTNNDHVQVRVYDSWHHDYHDWNDR
jgi:hypothetical protein